MTLLALSLLISARRRARPALHLVAPAAELARAQLGISDLVPLAVDLEIVGRRARRRASAVAARVSY